MQKINQKSEARNSKYQTNSNYQSGYGLVYAKMRIQNSKQKLTPESVREIGASGYQGAGHQDIREQGIRVAGYQGIRGLATSMLDAGCENDVSYSVFRVYNKT